MHHVWAATAAAVVSVGTTAVSSGMQASAASKAAKAQGAAGKKLAKSERAAMASQEKALKRYRKEQQDLTGEMAGIQAPVYDYAAMERDALKESQFKRAQVLGSEAQYEALRKQAMANISQGLAGQLTDAELGAVRREQAFLQGAGFNPAMAGRGAIQQRGQYDYLRAIGRTAGEAIQQAGNFLGQWTNIASAYLTGDPKQYGALQYQYGMGAANVGLSKINTRRQMLSDLYNAQLGLATGQQQMGQRQYERQQQQIATTLALEQQRAETLGKMGESVASGVSSVGNAYSQYAAAKASSIPQYSSLASAQQAAPYAGGYSQIQGMGYVPRATAV